jgi:beta-glucosidase
MLPGGAEDFLEGPKSALFPFGYGLSYTEFAYSDLQIEQLGDVRFAVHCNVKNVGPVDGDEVVQLYLDDMEGSVARPPMLLKGFKRIHLKAGEAKHVVFELDPSHFQLMDIRYNWTVEPGRFRVLVGAGSRDIRLEGMITL